jgi:acid phosphatase
LSLLNGETLQVSRLGKYKSRRICCRFANGYFGRSWGSLNTTAFATIAEDSTTLSWITPTNTCARWDYDFGNNATMEWGAMYLPPVARRLNALVPGLELSADDVHGALYACAYDLAAVGTSPWCGVFAESEIEDFECVPVPFSSASGERVSCCMNG